MNERLLTLGLHIERHLAEIEKLFKPHVKLTLIARTPGNDEADVLMTKDDLSEVAKLIQRREAGEVTFEPDVSASVSGR